MAEELDALQAAITHELELARDGDGYEAAGVAEEIVRFYAAPLLTEVDRLRREVEFEANGADTFAEADAREEQDEWPDEFGPYLEDAKRDPEFRAAYERASGLGVVDGTP